MYSPCAAPSKRGGRWLQKMPKNETFTSRFEETRGGYPKNLKLGETSFMDGEK